MERYARWTRWRHGNLPQMQFEPLLRRHADARSPGRVLFSHELVSLEQDEDGVLATVRDRERGATTRGAGAIPDRR